MEFSDDADAATPLAKQTGRQNRTAHNRVADGAF
jgi:hypothetical protein